MSDLTGSGIEPRSPVPILLSLQQPGGRVVGVMVANSEVFDWLICSIFCRTVMNPKSITMGELYGEQNPLTLEWKDGLMALTVRQAVQVRKYFTQTRALAQTLIGGLEHHFHESYDHKFSGSIPSFDVFAFIEMKFDPNYLIWQIQKKQKMKKTETKIKQNLKTALVLW